VNRVAGQGTTHQPQGKRFRYELYSNANSRIWETSGTRPENVFFGSVSGAAAVSTEPWDSATFGPGRPWTKIDSSGQITYEREDYIYIRAEAIGPGVGNAQAFTITGNPNATNSTTLSRFNHFAYGLTGPWGSGSVYQSDLFGAYTANFDIGFSFVTLPDAFDFTADVPPNCWELDPQPVRSTRNCEVLVETPGVPRHFTTTFPFVTGSTDVTLEGSLQVRGIHYDESPADHSIIFRALVPTWASVYVCYMVMH
jgi:hypothetical protein